MSILAMAHQVTMFAYGTTLLTRLVSVPARTQRIELTLFQDTVHNHVYNTCVPNERNSDPFVMKSPNKANRGGGMYCVIGTCRAQGDAYWDNTGRAGGP